MSLNETDPALARSLVETTMHLAAERGWHGFTLVEVALSAHIPLENIKRDYPFKALVLASLNNMADKAMLCGTEPYLSLREGLFDLFMRRFDAFQDYREGLRAVMHALPSDPPLATFLGLTTMNTIKWIADRAGLDRRGLGGKIRLQALMAVWIQTLRVWEKDETADLSDTMQALDKALNRAERFNLLKEVVRPPEETSLSTGGLPDYNSDTTSFPPED
ncbi:TetR family transcriptional regulator [Acetobacteraceae bacterium ESL0709]|nr:TetR family transcriptional regulator [Acetobacteraceae bacterium ESL0697]MDF7677192.1 TetR family transcriptional regulator [Acetobacteraceae bacterium ESL0709]